MDYAQYSKKHSRLPGATFALAVHVVIVYGLLTSLSVQVVHYLHGPIEARLLEDFKAPPPDAPPPPVKFVAPPPAVLPLPDIRIAQPAPSNTITATRAPPVPVVKPPPAAPVRKPPVIDARRSCRLPEYPAASRRLEETGTVVLRFLIDTSGRAIESRIDSSSGYPRLDEAARVALGSCRFKPGTVDGKPEPSWAAIKYTWKLN